MICTAHAKINWTLNITGKRADGYHLLESVMQRVALCDRLEILPAEELSLRGRGTVPVPEDKDNLVYKAARLLKEKTGAAAGARILLEKSIPAGAGLGGGSADAAAVLLGLNLFWGCGLGLPALERLALEIGADVPYCLHEEPMLVSGIGEILAPVPPLPSLPLVLVQDAEALSTPRIYREYDLLPPDVPADTQKALETIREKAFSPENNQVFCNMLQKPSVRCLPGIGKLIRALYENGALFAQMTGSGSCVFGVFSSESKAQKAASLMNGKVRTCLVTKTV